jgi:hypothetical protein
MEPTESSETSAINVTWTPGTYSKDNKLQLEHGEGLKSRIHLKHLRLSTNIHERNRNAGLNKREKNNKIRAGREL